MSVKLTYYFSMYYYLNIHSYNGEVCITVGVAYMLSVSQKEKKAYIMLSYVTCITNALKKLLHAFLLSMWQSA